MNDSHNTILEPLRERRSFGLSGLGLLLGLLIGLGLGLFYSWELDPVIVRNVAPEQLQGQDRQTFIIAAAQEYHAQKDLQQVIRRLLEVEPDQDPYQVAADTVCELIRSGEVDTVTDIEVIRSLRAIYESRGLAAECSTTAFDTPVPVTVVFSTATVTPSPTITPIATKTPTQPFAAGGGGTAFPLFTPSPASPATIRIARIEPFCAPELSGVIEVYVRDAAQVGVAGAAVQVTWDNGRQQEIFYTGLKPERGNDYADYTMEEGRLYRVGLREAPAELTDPLEAIVCDPQGTLRSYRVVIQRLQEPD